MPMNAFGSLVRAARGVLPQQTVPTREEAQRGSEPELPRRGVVKMIDEHRRYAEQEQVDWGREALYKWQQLAEEERQKRLYIEKLTRDLSEQLKARWNPAPEEMDDPETRPGMGTVDIERPPDLPVRRPMVDPVVALKKETARGYNYTPAATEHLYETPVHLYKYGPESPPDQEPDNLWWQGRYFAPEWEESTPGHFRQPGSGKIEVWENPEYRDRYPGTSSFGEKNPQFSVFDPEAVLAHEFGHEWYTTQMPFSTKWGWNARTKENIGSGEPYTQVEPGRSVLIESYADAAASRNQPDAERGFGTAGLSDEEWNKYYAGLYRDVSPKWRSKWDMRGTNRAAG